MIDFSAMLGNLWPTVIGGIAVYVGIRVDLARMHERITAQAKEIEEAKKLADRAHVRIDNMRGRT